jgi:carbonic anhydrase
MTTITGRLAVLSSSFGCCLLLITVGTTAWAHLHTKLIAVLGHDKRGAVTAAVEGAREPGHLKALVSTIQPSVKEAKNLAGDKIHNCMRANARHVAPQIRESEPVLNSFKKTA